MIRSVLTVAGVLCLMCWIALAAGSI